MQKIVKYTIYAMQTLIQKNPNEVIIVSISTFAAIDVGSNELSMKIFEISKKTGIRELDYIRYAIKLGSDTYNYGKISNPLVAELCNVMDKFNEKMNEYRVSECVAYATSAIREAKNSLFILEQIKLRSGIKVKVLSNSEQRFLCYKAIALKETSFNKLIQKGTAIVDIGAGSIQISLFDKASLVLTQNIRLGALRVKEILSNLENECVNFYQLISEYINQDIQTFRSLYLDHHDIKNIIAIGENIPAITSYFNSATPIETLNRQQFEELYASIRLKSVETISRELNISKEQATLFLPTAMIFHKIFAETNAELMWFPGTTLCDGIAAEYAWKKEKIIPSHDFTADIIASARNIAERYLCNVAHISHVETIALTMFDNIKKVHGLGKRERLLLQIAIILHNCGEYINMTDEYNNSYHIIMSTEIIGLSHVEREIVANIVRYNSENFPSLDQIEGTIDKETYTKIAKLTAIFRLANAMDISHKQKFANTRITVRDYTMNLTVSALEDITLEHGLFEKKALFFEEVFGIKPILKHKRSI